MKITSVRLGRISVPLRTPFKTALRSVSSVEDVIVEIRTDCDTDTLLYLCTPDGPTCHTGAQSCFFNVLMEEKE